MLAVLKYMTLKIETLSQTHYLVIYVNISTFLNQSETMHECKTRITRSL